MSNILLKGIMPALITPFDENEKLKASAVREIIDYEYANGVDGFYINGSTGEGPALGVKTRIEMSETAVECNKGRGVIIEHIGAPDFADAVELTKHAQRVGVDVISSLAPNFYFSFTDDEIVEYYKKIASLTDRPLIVYATSLIKTDVFRLVERLMKIEGVIGLKFTLPDYYLMSRLCRLNGGNINVINGPDEMLICGLSMGAQGGIGSTYNVMPDWFVSLYNCFKDGSISAAREWQYKINTVVEILLRYGENGCVKSVKEALKLKGFDAGNAVFPAKEYSKEETQGLKNELEKAGIVF